MIIKINEPGRKPNSSMEQHQLPTCNQYLDLALERCGFSHRIDQSLTPSLPDTKNSENSLKWLNVALKNYFNALCSSGCNHRKSTKMEEQKLLLSFQPN